MDTGLQGDVRMGFIRKVFGILFTQLLATTLFVSWIISMNMGSFIIRNEWLIYVAAFGSIGCNLALTFSTSLARTVPTNYLILALFTLCQSYMVSVICYFTEPEIVIKNF